MTAIEKSHREWMEQGHILARKIDYSKSDSDSSLMASPEPTVVLRQYDPRRLGYTLTAHPAAQLSRSRTSGGTPPLLHRDVLRSSGSLFARTEADGSGLPHAESKIASFKRNFQQLSVERAFPDGHRVTETSVQDRVKTALKDIVKNEESKRSGQPDEQAELVQSTLVISCGPQRVMLEVKQSVHVDSAEAARKKAADAAAAAAAAAELRASIDPTGSQAAAAPKEGDAYNHTGADEGAKHHHGSGRPGPGGGGGGVSRVVGAAESAERDKYNSEKRNEVRLSTPHTGTSGSEVGDNRRGGTAAPGTIKSRGRGAEAALSPIEQAYATKPWTRIQVLPSRRSVIKQQPWNIAYALQPQEYFDGRLRRKTDAVTGRVSKFAAENNRLWMRDFEQQMASSLVPLGLPDRKFSSADRPWAVSASSPHAASPTSTRSRTAGASPSLSSPEWRLPAPPPHARTSPLKRMIEVGVFEPAAAPPCPPAVQAKFKPDASLSKRQLKQWKHLMRSSSYGGLVGVAEDAAKLGHIRRRVPELGGAK